MDNVCIRLIEIICSSMLKKTLELLILFEPTSAQNLPNIWSGGRSTSARLTSQKFKEILEQEKFLHEAQNFQ